MIDDSKRLKPGEREKLSALIDSWAGDGHLFQAFGSASQEEVDQHNMFDATVIAMASIFAKVKRDGLMVEIHRQFPRYFFDSNKGYCSPDQKRGIREFGPWSIHRMRLLANVNLNPL